MSKDCFKILSPCGILGYGFPESSFERGLADAPDAIVVDAGSTDAGPHKLGANTAIVSRAACKRDIRLMYMAAIKLGIPVIIGSAGGSGGRKHVEWMLSIIDEMLEENGLTPLKTAVIYADIDKDEIRRRMAQGKVEPLGGRVPLLTEQRLDETTGVVAQMGIEPILEALKGGAQAIICGRAYDPSPFAAAGVFNGFDKALAYHMGKVLECGALCSEPGTTKDCMMGVLYKDCFEVYPTNPIRRCTTVTVAAHTFYEKEHPYLLRGPGVLVDLSQCEFTQVSDNRVRVTGSRITDTERYQIKLEGARKAAYRTFVIAGVRDPIMVGRIEEIEALVKANVMEQYGYVDPSTYAINFYNYGKNAVMGELEPINEAGHELGVLFEVIADTQEKASMICSSLRSTFLHYGYEGRKSTAGNLAFPFAPSDVEFGAVYEFSVYHLMEIEDAKAPFPIVYSH